MMKLVVGFCYHVTKVIRVCPPESSLGTTGDGVKWYNWFHYDETELFWLSPSASRWWWPPDTPTAPPSPSLSPGCATCCSAPPWGAPRRTTTIPPPLRLHPSRPRRSWAMAPARGRPRKPSSTSHYADEAASDSPGWAPRDGTSHSFSRERGGLTFHQMRPFLLEQKWYFQHFMWHEDSVNTTATVSHFNPTWTF